MAIYPFCESSSTFRVSAELTWHFFSWRGVRRDASLELVPRSSAKWRSRKVISLNANYWKYARGYWTAARPPWKMLEESIEHVCGLYDMYSHPPAGPGFLNENTKWTAILPYRCLICTTFPYSASAPNTWCAQFGHTCKLMINCRGIHSCVHSLTVMTRNVATKEVRTRYLSLMLIFFSMQYIFNIYNSTYCSIFYICYVQCYRFSDFVARSSDFLVCYLSSIFP